MDEDLHNIEDLFFEALDDIEEKASQSVWEGVERRLDKENIVSIKKKYTNIKRIAILLLLLLGISLYEMNRIYNSNSLAKNGTAGHQNQRDSNQSIDKANDVKPGNISGIAGQLRNTDNAIIRNEQPATSGNESNKLADKEKEVNANNQLSQNAKAMTTINAQNNYSKNQAISKSLKNGRLTSKPFYKIKIKNATTAEDQQLTAQTKSNPAVYQIPFLESLKNIPIENAILKSKNSIDVKKSMPSLLASAIKSLNTSSNNIVSNEKKRAKRLSHFAITPFFSPDIAWYNLQDDNINNQTGNANDIDAEEKHEFSATYGALIDYKISDHWGLQSGLTISNTNINTEPEIIYAQPDNTGSIKYRINTSSGYGFILPSYSTNPAIGDSLYSFTSTHSLRYIGIPMAATYSFAKDKFIFSAKAGASINFLTKGKIETTVEKGFDNSTETVNNIQGLKKLNFSGLAAIGVDYKLTKRMSLAFMPTMRFALTSINKNTIVKSYPMSFGSSIGLKIGL